MAAAYQLSGKVALVTGAARGIGLETARALVGRGASVVVVDLDPEAAESAAAQLHDSRAIGLAADVTDRRAVQQAVATAVDRFGGLDVVVANAGIASRAATFRAMATEGFERVVDVNLMGVVRTVDAALPEIVRRRGHVVVIASVYAFGNGVGATPYAMSKAAVEQFGRALRVELVAHGASASVAYFGYIDTEMVHRAIDADRVLTTVLATFPKPLQKRLQPAAAGEAIVRGIERRAPRIIRPRAWVVMSTLRGIVNPLLDLRMERDATMQAAVRELDARADEEQPTTA
ncbi:MAG TPA: short-chain dehydrogenase/reductase [Solirubrobacteraceae bacterium]|nr:short-chain dehydrogenase/reductase [Solirubrobacteraceae bacterium]